MKTLPIWTLLLLLFFAGCAKVEKNELVGTWVREGDGKEITLTSDGAYIYQFNDTNSLKGMWRLGESGGLEIGIPDFDASMLVKAKFELKGNTLTIIDEKGGKKVFEKKI
ncbi:hypothetical protein [Coraliomargarita sinensis]|nr:hypothetical protein [Coraliomargarita sinensis]